MNLRQQAKVETRAKIIRSASILFRKHGIAATGIDAIMADAGLTAGGFYSHFESKDALIAATLSGTLVKSRELLRNAAANSKDPLDGISKMYLSPAHRDTPTKGCILAALSGELPRFGKEVHGTVASYLEDWISYFQKSKPTMSREQAARTVATAVGSLVLSRMVKGTDLSDLFLEVGKTKSKRR